MKFYFNFQSKCCEITVLVLHKFACSAIMQSNIKIIASLAEEYENSNFLKIKTDVLVENEPTVKMWQQRT